MLFFFFPNEKKEIDLDPKVDDMIFKERKQDWGICGGHCRNWPLVTVLISSHVLAPQKQLKEGRDFFWLTV